MILSLSKQFSKMGDDVIRVLPNECYTRLPNRKLYYVTRTVNEGTSLGATNNTKPSIYANGELTCIWCDVQNYGKYNDHPSI